MHNKWFDYKAINPNKQYTFIIGKRGAGKKAGKHGAK